MISNQELLDNMTANEKFDIICRTKNIDEYEMLKKLYRTITTSVFYENDDMHIGEYSRSSTDGWSCGEEFGGKLIFLDNECFLTRTEAEQKYFEEFKEDIEDGEVSTDGSDIQEWIFENYIIIDNEEKEFIEMALECGATEFKLPVDDYYDIF